MKILRLNLCNLASIAGEHSIDFESEPLSNAGLIAITGKTGAGKSTLLDAMCLALYDQIPRLNGAVGSLKDPSGQGISIKDSKIFYAVVRPQALLNLNLSLWIKNAILHVGIFDVRVIKWMGI